MKKIGQGAMKDLSKEREKGEILYNIEYDEIVEFKERITRFTVKFAFRGEKEKGGKIEDTAHLHDTGRLRELLVEGAQLLIRKAGNPERKTGWDVIAVRVSGETVLINTSFHRYISEAIFRNEKISPFGIPLKIRPEIKYRNSRMDFYLEAGGSKRGSTGKGKILSQAKGIPDKNPEEGIRGNRSENLDGNLLKGEPVERIYVEVKGCTLVEGETAKFPGAPSARAVKHLQELMEIKEEGLRAAVLILIFRKAERFAPEHYIDRLFAETFYEAIEKGVEVYPFLLEFKDKEIYFRRELEISKKSF